MEMNCRMINDKLFMDSVTTDFSKYMHEKACVSLDLFLTTTNGSNYLILQGHRNEFEFFRYWIYRVKYSGL
jgi:hypothetical protein